MSYGAAFLNAARELDVYVGRVLKGDKPADLPVHEATKASHTRLINVRPCRIHCARPQRKCPQDLKRDAMVAWRRFVSSVRSLPADQAAPSC